MKKRNLINKFKKRYDINKKISKIKQILIKILKWRYFYFSIVILFSCFFMFPFLFKYISGDDTYFHLANIKIYSKISIFNKIVPGVMNDLGWGVGIFYPCLPHVIGGLILKIISNYGFTAVLAIRIVKFIITVFSGIFMYILGNKLYCDKRKGMFVSLLYLSSNYFFVDIYMRDAINESAIFVFMPLIFLSFIYLFKEKNKKLFYVCFISGYVGLVYSHLVLTMWFTIMLIPFLLIHIKKIFNKYHFFTFLKAIVICVCLVSTFLFPLIEHMSGDKWFIPSYKNVWIIPFKDLFISQQYKSLGNLLFFNFSLIVIVLSILGIYNLLFKKKYYYDKKFLTGVLLFSIMSMILTSLSVFWKNAPDIFKSIQFSWRLCTFSVFGLSLFAVSGIDNLYNLFKKKYECVMTALIIIIISIFSINNISKVNFTEWINFNLNSKVFVKDYLPKKSVDNLDYISELDSSKIEVSDETVSAKIIKKGSSYLKFKVIGIRNEVVVQLPRFYYFGYQITDSKGHIIKYKESKKGLIKLILNRNDTYEVKYLGTFSYKIAVILKSITIVFILAVIIKWLLSYCKDRKTIKLK